MLRKKSNLLITTADKGGALVILDYDFYKTRMMEEHLSDNGTYTPIEDDNNYKVMNKVITLCKLYKTSFTQKEFKFLTKFHPQTPFLYGLPKLHKHTAHFDLLLPDSFGCISVDPPTDLRFRPIISSRFAPTSRLSAFLDELLKYFVPGVRSYLKDTFQFLDYLPRSTEQDSMLVSFDVVSLYTSIPHDLGYQSLEFWFDKMDNVLPSRFDKRFILDGIKLILENNYFTFEDSIYLQQSGTAMGTKVAPTYATLVMGFLEHNMYGQIHDNFPRSADSIMNSWRRYLDDCFMICQSMVTLILSLIF
jgi:hypothetical protein